MRSSTGRPTWSRVSHLWPYDQGGCGCAQCRPWGTNGFLKAGGAVAALARKKLPGTKIVLSTWFFDEGRVAGAQPGIRRKKALC